MITDMIGLYVHIPFCLKKCNYCDFCSFDGLCDKEKEQYVSALTKEIKSYKREPKISVNTVFFGGGTPSLLTQSQFENIYEAIKDSFDISGLAEFTVEANPKTLTAEKLSMYKKAGVSRISIGLQSIHQNELKILGRIHNFEDFLTSFNMARELGFDNINVDIMYGIPNQSKESFIKTLDAVTALGAEHISVYGLIIEENTVFADKLNELNLPSEDDEADMYDKAVAFLNSKGYCHYEISNYAKPGFESKHNLTYWRDLEYIGVGINAYSYFEGYRYGNTGIMSEYFSDNMEKYRAKEHITKKDMAYEYAMLRLRLSEGLSLCEYKERYGYDLLSEKREIISKYSRLGYIKITDDRLALTDKGFYISNSIITDLL